MANNQKKLKAFVRYDGSGRVVASSLILRKNKPRVGRWYEIPEYLCCNGTTNTTTTQGGGGGTPTAWFGQISATGSSDAWKACNGAGNSIIVYTSSTSIGSGTYFYSDAALTTVIPYAFGSISIQGTVYEIENGRVNPLSSGQSCAGITTTTSTTQALTLYNGDYSFNPAGDPCIGTGQFNLPLVVDQNLNPCGGATVTLASGTWASYGINPGATISVNFGTQGNPGQIIRLNVFGTNTCSNLGCVACPPRLRWATASASAACSSSNTLSFTFNNASFCSSTELVLNTTSIGGNGTNFYAWFEGNAYLCIVTSPNTAATSDNCIPTTC